QTAKAREDQLVAEVNTLKAASARAGEQQVELDALQRDANAQRQQLESYMASYREAASRADRNYLPVDARLLSKVQVPTEPYFPKIGPITGAAAAASLLLMAIGTLLKELFSGRAMRPAAGARFEPIEQVAMPVARTEPAVVEAEDEDGDDSVAKDRIGQGAAMVAAPAEPAEAESPQPWRSRLGEIAVNKAAEKLTASGA
ncbi:chain-length determining protein, partial [Mesorhizobium sp. USDA-HM6]